MTKELIFTKDVEEIVKGMYEAYKPTMKQAEKVGRKQRAEREKEKEKQIPIWNKKSKRYNQMRERREVLQTNTKTIKKQYNQGEHTKDIFENLFEIPYHKDVTIYNELIKIVR